MLVIDRLKSVPNYVLIAMAYQGHIVIPTTNDKSEHVIESITTSMADRFGGYSRYNGSGGWEANGNIVEEEHIRLVVTVKTDDSPMDWDQLCGWLRSEARWAKEVLDEDAVLVEINEIHMELV